MNAFNHNLAVIALIASALVSGVFFAFSTFVMRALAQLAPGEGIRAMQAVNRAAITPGFMIPLFGNGLVVLAVGISACLRLGQPGARWILAGSCFYLAGAVLITVFFNVPRNDKLAATDADAAESAAYWQRYLREWTAWNHARTIATAFAAAAFLTALLEGWGR